MNDPYEKEREIEQAAYDRGEIDNAMLNQRLREIDREEYADAQERASREYERSMDDSGFGRW